MQREKSEGRRQREEGSFTCCTGLEQSFCLHEAEALGAARDNDDLVLEAELREEAFRAVRDGVDA